MMLASFSNMETIHVAAYSTSAGYNRYARSRVSGILANKRNEE